MASEAQKRVVQLVGKTNLQSIHAQPSPSVRPEDVDRGVIVSGEQGVAYAVRGQQTFVPWDRIRFVVLED